MKKRSLLILFVCLVTRVHGGLSIPLPADETDSASPPAINVPPPSSDTTPAKDVPPAPDKASVNNRPARWQDYMLEPEQATNDIIRLISGDGFTGRLLRLTETGVEWQLQVPVINKPIHFRSTGIHSIRLAAKDDKSPRPAPRWVVRLTNGDWLVGNDLTMDATQVEVTTATGRRQVKRAFVAELQQNGIDGALPCLEYPNDWKRTRGKRYFQYKDLSLPDNGEAIFTFRADSKRQLEIQLFGGGPALGKLRLEVDGLSVGVRGFRTKVIDGVEYEDAQLITIPLRPAPGRTTVDLGVRWDLNGQAEVVINGEVKITGRFVRDMTTQSNGAGICTTIGPGVLYRELMPYPYPEVVPYMRLRRLPKLLPLTPPAPEDDRVQFANSETLDGTIEAIDAQKIVVSGPLGRLELPVERFALGKLAVAKQRQSEMPAKAVRIGFRDGSEVTAAILEGSETEWILGSPMLGNLTVARQAVSRLDWSGDWNFTSTPTNAAESARPGAIQLVDGTQLPGTLNGFGADTVQWRLPGAEETVEFPIADIVRLSTTTPRWRERLPAVVVELITGDQISGEVLEIDAEVVRLHPMNAVDAVAIRRPQIKQLRLNRAEAQVHWLLPTQSASQELALSERTAVRLELPDEVLDKGTFTAVVTGQSTLQGPTATAAAPPPVALLIMKIPIAVGQRQLIVSLHSKSKLEIREGHKIQVPPGQPLFLTWLIDPNEQAMYLLNGRKIAVRAQSPTPLPNGGQITFSANVPTRLMSSISPWRGSLDALGNDPPATPDWVLLDDLTVVDGTLTSVHDGQATITVDGKKTNVPLDRIAQISFTPAERADAPPADALRVDLVDGDQVALTNPRYEQGVVSGKVGGIGAVTLPVSAILRMEFQPAKAPAAETQ